LKHEGTKAQRHEDTHKEEYLWKILPTF